MRCKMHNELIDLKTAAIYLGVKESWLRLKVFKREISFIKLGRLIRFKKTSLDTYLNANMVNQKP